jgi:hypothetical protein
MADDYSKFKQADDYSAFTAVEEPQPVPRETLIAPNVAPKSPETGLLHPINTVVQTAKDAYNAAGNIGTQAYQDYQIIRNSPSVPETIGNIAGGAARVAGNAVGAVLSPVISGVKNLFPGTVNAILNAPIRNMEDLDAPAPSISEMGQYARSKWEDFKNKNPRFAQQIENAASIGNLIPMAKGLQIEGSLAKNSPNIVGSAISKTGKTIEDIGKPSNLSTTQQEMNSAAQKINMPLTKGEVSAAPGSKIGGGVWGSVERVIKSLPGAQGVFEKMNADKAASAVKAIENVYGKPISSLDDDVASKISDNIEKSYKGQKNLFAGSYADAIDQGKVSYIDGSKAAQKVASKLENSVEYNNLPDKTKNIVNNYVNRLYNIKSNITTAGGIGSNYESYRYLQTDLNSSINQLRDKLYQGAQGISPSEAQRTISTLQQIKTTMKANEYLHLRMIGGNDLVDNLKVLDRLYGEESAPLQVVKKMFGIGKDVGEKGYVSSDNALDAMLNPKNIDKLNIAMNYASDDTKQLIAQSAIGKVIRSSSKIDYIGGNPQISQVMVGKLGQNVEKYRDVLEAVLPKEKMDQLNTAVTGIRRGNVASVNLLDPENPSGTAAKSNIMQSLLEAIMIGGAAGFSMHHIIASLVGIPVVGGQMLAANKLAKFVTNQGSSAINKAGTTIKNIGNAVRKIGKGNEISQAEKSYGVTFNGVQKDLQGNPVFMTFTDQKTGSSFAAKSVQDIPGNLAKMRKGFTLGNMNQ